MIRIAVMYHVIAHTGRANDILHKQIQPNCLANSIRFISTQAKVARYRRR